MGTGRTLQFPYPKNLTFPRPQVEERYYLVWGTGSRCTNRAKGNLKTPENPGHLLGGGDMGDAIEEKGHH
jgi:hypothetical protein